jgi:hypothetical protein
MPGEKSFADRDDNADFVPCTSATIPLVDAGARRRLTSGTDGHAEERAMVKLSIWDDCQHEIDCYKWIESEHAGYDVGNYAVRRWIKEHWSGYLRARWIEHLQGKKFWTELDSGDFGLLKKDFKEQALLLDRIIDRVIAGQENLHILCWAHDWQIAIQDVLEILDSLNINSKRLAHRFDD